MQNFKLSLTAAKLELILYFKKIYISILKNSNFRKKNFSFYFIKFGFLNFITA